MINEDGEYSISVRLALLRDWFDSWRQEQGYGGLVTHYWGNSLTCVGPAATQHVGLINGYVRLFDATNDRSWLAQAKEIVSERDDLRFLFVNLSARHRALLKVADEGRNMLIGTDYLKRMDLLELLAKSKILLFPSIWEETMGYAVMEAGLLGTLPTATKLGGTEWVVKGTAAEKYLVEFGPEFVIEFSQKVREALGDDENVEAHGIVMLQMSRKFGDTYVATTRSKLYEIVESLMRR